MKQPFDLTDYIIRYESGELDETETLALFQHLVNSGMAWTLQGSYGRTAKALIERGMITPGFCGAERGYGI